MAAIGEAGFRPFDLLDDDLVLEILRCLAEPESLGRVALASKRLAALCAESYAWKPLLDSALSSSGGSLLALPREGTGWRARYKEWHTLSSLSWSHCPWALHCLWAVGSAQPSGRYLHGAAAVSADRAYVFGGSSGGHGHGGQLSELLKLRRDAAANSGTASWERVAPTSEHTPIARAAATLSPVSLSDSAHPVGLLLFGGWSGESDLNDVWLFDTRTTAWTMLLPHTAQAANASVRPDGRGAHSAITHNSSEVVIFGGTATGPRCFNDMLSFSVRTRQWTLHECAGASPCPRFGHSACRVAESMFVFGGSTFEFAFNDLWEYALDTRAWTQVVSTGGSAPSPRLYHSLTPLGSRLVVLGGRDLHAANSFDSALHCFDLQRRRWSDLAVGGRHPRARTGHAAIPCGGGVLIFGGCGSTHVLKGTFLLRVWP
jgi:hypothetical protein